MNRCALIAKKIGRTYYGIDGHMDVKGASGAKVREVVAGTDGHEHKITLTCEDYIEVKEQHLQHAVLKARGTKRLKWGPRQRGARSL